MPEREHSRHLWLVLVGAMMSALACDRSETTPLVIEEQPAEFVSDGFDLEGPGATMVAFNDNYHDAAPFEICLVDYVTSEVFSLPGLATALPGNSSLSAGGQFLAFDDVTHDRAEDDFGSDRNIYIHDRHSSSAVSVPFNTDTYMELDPSISGMGRYIAFTSDRTGSFNVFIYDRLLQKLVSLPRVNTSLYSEQEPSLSADARYLAFSSNRSGRWKIYLYDVATNTFEPTPGPLNEPARSGDRHDPDIDVSGRFIVHTVLGPDSSTTKVSLYDRMTASLIDMPGVDSGLGEEQRPSISMDGSYVAFERNEEPGDYHPGVLVYDRQAASLRSVDAPDCTDGYGPSLQNRTTR